MKRKHASSVNPSIITIIRGRIFEKLWPFLGPEDLSHLQGALNVNEHPELYEEIPKVALEMAKDDESSLETLAKIYVSFKDEEIRANVIAALLKRGGILGDSEGDDLPPSLPSSLGNRVAALSGNDDYNDCSYYYRWNYVASGHIFKLEEAIENEIERDVCMTLGNDDFVTTSTEGWGDDYNTFYMTIVRPTLDGTVPKPVCDLVVGSRIYGAEVRPSDISEKLTDLDSFLETASRYETDPCTHFTVDYDDALDIATSASVEELTEWYENIEDESHIHLRRYDASVAFDALFLFLLKYSEKFGGKFPDEVDDEDEGEEVDDEDDDGDDGEY